MSPGQLCTFQCNFRGISGFFKDRKIEIMKLYLLSDTLPIRDNQFVGAKYSSAYCPPEMIESVVNGCGCTIYVRAYRADVSGVPNLSDIPSELLSAHPSYDMWSLGASLF